MARFDRDEVETRIIKILAASLALTPGEIKPEARLVQDLGMDSLDFLDVLFSLEQEFGLPIRDPDFNRLLRPDKSELARSGEYLTAEEVSAMGPLLPMLAAAAVDQPVRRRDVYAFLTVDSLVRVVERKLADAA
jgi:acyl carrier protein